MSKHKPRTTNKQQQPNSNNNTPMSSQEKAVKASQAQVDSGSEFAVMGLMVFIIVSILVPPCFIISCFVYFVSQGEYGRALTITVVSSLAILHIFVVGRFNASFTGHLVRFLYGWISPLLLVAALTYPVFPPGPDSPPRLTPEVALADPIAAVARFTVPAMRFAALPAATKLAMLLQSPRLQGLAIALAARVSLFIYRCAVEPPRPDPMFARYHGSERRMRIVLAGDAFAPKVDGVATFTQHAIKHLQEFGHKVTVMTSIKGPEKLFGADVVRVPGFITPKAKDHSVSLPTPMILWHFLKLKPDHVHLFEVGILTVGLYLLCHIAHIPCSFSHHTRVDMYINMITPNWPEFLNTFAIFVAERFFHPFGDVHLTVCKPIWDKVVLRLGSLANVDPTTSPEAATALRKSDVSSSALTSVPPLMGSLKGSVRYWRSGVNEAFRRPAGGTRSKAVQAVRERFSNGRPDLPMVIHVGRLAVEKFSEELPDIVKASKALIGSDNVRFAIVGDGVLMPQVRKRMDDDVHFAGFLQGQDLLDAYSCADVFFSPSTSEAFPLVYLEAMRTGLAVVGPRAGGVPEAFDDNVQGTLFEPHDPKSAAEAIKRAIEGGKAMRERAAAHGDSFTWERSIRELEAACAYAVEKKEATMFKWRRWLPWTGGASSKQS